MKHQNLQIRTKQFALQVIKFCEGLPKDDTSRILGRQLLRSGTSVGANYRAACRAKSKPAFISKMGDVLEESDESGYWVELLSESGKVDEKSAAPVLREANELVAIAVSPLTRPSETQERKNNRYSPRKNGPGGDSAFCIPHSALESLPARAISTKNKHLLLSCDTNPRFHGGSFGV